MTLQKVELLLDINNLSTIEGSKKRNALDK